MNVSTDCPLFCWNYNSWRARLSHSLLTFAFLLLLLLFQPGEIHAQEFQRIDDFFMVAANDQGTIILGYIRELNDEGSVISTTPARWDRGTLSEIEELSEGDDMILLDLDGAGRIIVGYAGSESIHGEIETPLFLINGEIETGPSTLDIGRGMDELNSISEDGSLVVGGNQEPEMAVMPAFYHIESEKLTVLPCSVDDSACSGRVWSANANGVVKVGTVASNDGFFVSKAARWDDSTLTVAPISEIDEDGFDAGEIRAHEVTPDGKVILGTTQRNTELANFGGPWYRTEMWLWEGNTVTQIPPYPDYRINSRRGGNAWDAHDISADGSTVLAYCEYNERPVQEYYPCIWNEQDGWRKVPDMIAAAGVDISSIEFIRATHLSDDGRAIIGLARDLNTGSIFTYRFGPPFETALVVTEISDEEDPDPNDESCDVNLSESGLQCTLRSAIQEANNRSGVDEITFNIEGQGAHTISVDSPLPAFEEAVIIDATTQPGFEDKPLVFVDGTGVAGDGFILDQEETVIIGIGIGGFGGAGIHIQGPGQSRVEQSYIGVAADGLTANPNLEGIRITDSPENIIGGKNEDEGILRNIISGNTEAGIIITGSASTQNVVASNYIGTDATGTAAVANGGNGIVIEGASENLIGGPEEIDGNVVSGNSGTGVLIRGHLTEGSAEQNQVFNNLIGLTGAGDQVLFNTGQTAIRVEGAAPLTQIGRENAGNFVVVDLNAIELIDLGEEIGAPDGSQVSANSIGTTTTGSVLGTTIEDRELFGITISTESNGGGTVAVIGGEDAGSGNKIPNAVIGILVEGPRSSESVIAHNQIGNLTEVVEMEERNALGIWINGANNLTISNNVVSGNSIGILLGSRESSLTLNKIGTNSSGNQARPNTIGLWIPGEVGPQRFSTGDANQIGAPNGYNLISGNQLGLLIGGSFDFFSENSKVRKTKHRNDLRSRMLTVLPDVSRRTNHFLLNNDSLKAKMKQIQQEQLVENGRPDSNIVAFNRIGTTNSGNSQLGNGRSASSDESTPGVVVEDGMYNQFLGNVISGNGSGVRIGPDPDFVTYPENTILAGNVIGGSLSTLETEVPNQYGGVVIFNTKGNRLQALPLTEGGDPVGNTIQANGEGGVQIVIIDEEDIGNQIRQSSFINNQGPSIILWNSEEEYPAIAPEIPRILSAAALSGNASVRFASSVSGVVDGFISEGCDDGHAQGRYAFSINVEPGTSVVDLPYNRLDSDSENATSLFLALTLTSAGEAGMTSEFSECYRIARESDVDSTAFSINDEGELINGAGIKVEINSNADKQSVKPAKENRLNPDTEGMLYVTRYRVEPVEGQIDGIATSHDGSEVTPDMASIDRYWSLRTTGIDSINYSVCLDIEELPGADVPEQLVVLHRRSVSQSWKPYDSTLENGQLCTSGLTRFGEIGIGGNGDVNYLPVEPDVVDLPTEFELKSNYPNPFNPSTVIPYSLPQATHVKLEVYDMTGRKTATLLNKSIPAGQHEIVFNAGNLASGVYIIRMEAGVFTSTQKMLLMK